MIQRADGIYLERMELEAHVTALASEGEAFGLVLVESLACGTPAVGASEAFWQASKENIQTHGGMGFTWEFDTHLFLLTAAGDYAAVVHVQGTFTDSQAFTTSKRRVMASIDGIPR